MADKPHAELEVGDRTVRLSSPDRVYFPLGGQTKLDVARYYLAVGPGIVRALRERPCMLHRFPDGTEGPRIYQKRLPKGAPDWVETVEVRFPSGRTADELCVTELASVIWAVQMSTVEFHPWHSRRADTERPDELRIDLDPQPGTGLAEAKAVALVVQEVLAEVGAVGWPNAKGSCDICFTSLSHMASRATRTQRARRRSLRTVSSSPSFGFPTRCSRVGVAL